MSSKPIKTGFPKVQCNTIKFRGRVPVIFNSKFGKEALAQNSVRFITRLWLPISEQVLELTFWMKPIYEQNSN